MSAADKSKLDGVTASANNYAHPVGGAASKAAGLYKIATDATSHISSVTAVTKEDITSLGIPAQDTNTTYGAATASAAGLMSAADKARLDAVAADVGTPGWKSVLDGSAAVYEDKGILINGDAVGFPAFNVDGKGRVTDFKIQELTLRVNEQLGNNCYFAACATAAATAAKTAAPSNFTLVAGARVTVVLTNGNKAAAPTHNVAG
jgi:hypothetical protein